MLFSAGLVHCDLHPGNWWFLPDGRLALVDAGFVFRLDDTMRRRFMTFFLAMSAGHADVCADQALACSIRPVGREPERRFRADLADLVDRVHGKLAAEFSLLGFARDFFDIQRRHGAFSQAEFVFPLIALLAVEGQVRKLDPAADFQAVARPIILRAMIRPAGCPPAVPLSATDEN
jgi:ubiquinone biosynthesis protein